MRAVDRNDLTKRIVRQLDDQPGASRLLDAILGARALLEDDDMSAREVAESISAHPGLEVPPPARDIFIDRFAALVDIQEFAALSRAIHLYSQASDNLFCTARTISELIPVFGSDESTDIVAMFLKHTLRIDYHPNADASAGSETISLTLDEDDISTLQAALARALQKDIALKSYVSGSKLPLLQIEVEH